MMGNAITFPVPDSAGLGDRLTRWMNRWRCGGIEQYAAGDLIHSREQWSGGERFGIERTITDRAVHPLDAIVQTHFEGV